MQALLNKVDTGIDKDEAQALKILAGLILSKPIALSRSSLESTVKASLASMLIELK